MFTSLITRQNGKITKWLATGFFFFFKILKDGRWVRGQKKVAHQMYYERLNNFLVRRLMTFEIFLNSRVS